MLNKKVGGIPCMNSQVRKYIPVGLLVLIAVIVVVAIAQVSRGPTKKPTPERVVPLAPEVAKYKQEPTISLYRHKLGGTVQWLPLEKYLEGVVAAEVGTNPPLEALKAQAIVARTLTLALINYQGGTPEHKTNACDLHTHFQAYDESQVTDKIRKAVSATRGQVLTYNGRFIYAEFHSCSGGKTASIEEAFPKLAEAASAYIKPLASPGMKYAPAKERKWTVKIPRWELKNILGPESGSLDDIKISKRGPSGRALVITAGKASIPAVDLRTQLGPDRLKSTMITSIRPQGDYVVFTGKGWGHGAGMEQWGAYAMAKKGKSAADIVTYYYPGTRLVTLWK